MISRRQVQRANQRDYQRAKRVIKVNQCADRQGEIDNSKRLSGREKKESS